MDYIRGLVSVIMPTYKRVEKLSRAIESVLSQSYKNLELLLVNDNEPNDEYSEKLKVCIEKYYSDKRFKFIVQDRHVNGAVARNIAIKKAKGEYIAFLDDDDWWEKEKLEHQIKVLKSLPNEWGGVSCKYRFFDSLGNVIGSTNKYRDGYIYRDILFLLSDVATSTLLLRHTALDNAGYFDESLLRHQDLQLLINFTYQYKLKEIDEYLHCCDISDSKNRPNGEKLLECKKSFFRSIKPVLNQMSKEEIKCAYCIHKFELGYVFIRNRDLKKGFGYCLAIFRSPKAALYAGKKVVDKILIYKRKDKRYEKY